MSGIDRMIDYLTTNGWAKWTLGYDGGPRCLVGASSECDAYEDLAAVRDVVVEQYPDRLNRAFVGNLVGPIVSFNDHGDTTIADVLLVLEKARAHE